MNQSENINELATALSRAQGKIIPAIKDSSNPFFKSKYADLTSVWNSCRTPLADNNLSVIQTMDSLDGHLVLITTLAHSSGQWMRSIIPLNPVKNDPQSMGSIISYMRRYSLAAICGVTTDEDDDGNAASDTSARIKHKGAFDQKIDTMEKARPLNDTRTIEINFAISEEFEMSDVFNFIKHSAQSSNNTQDFITARANDNPKKFIISLREWITKKAA